MRRAPWGFLRRLSAAALVAAALTVAAGCSYLQWRQANHDQRARLTKNPTELSLEREYAPQDCFGLSGFGETHVGILSDPKALETLARVLAQATEGRP